MTKPKLLTYFEEKNMSNCMLVFYFIFYFSTIPCKPVSK